MGGGDLSVACGLCSDQFFLTLRISGEILLLLVFKRYFCLFIMISQFSSFTRFYSLHTFVLCLLCFKDKFSMWRYKYK